MAKKLTKTTINFWLDTFLLCVFLALCCVSVILRYVFPPGTDSAGWTLWGLDFLAWNDVQFFTLCLLAASVLLHVMLHWTWVCGVIGNWVRKSQSGNTASKADNGSRTLWGVGLLIALLNVLGLVIAAASLTIKGPLP
ncbi:DUF4405 domain-containing protein [Bythopirellula goksoeyrii]|uniref:Flavinylation-associated cytochrome domain-containing protein n=1 Tax=Bythopirellula goksoeyrii TaxID=1400387 RepID=A0A5B9Q7W2_9BACT|nr:DUF4405 domain-containing protein [Bythopirellula goksoeyrii]QEG33820.1 hypothetical protein Pr1d_10900 [Bythopirellula goksoeyrii]